METSKMLNVLIFSIVLKQSHGFLILTNRSSVYVTKPPHKNTVNKGWGAQQDWIDKRMEEQWRSEETITKGQGDYPPEFDWSKENAVSPVKDQQSCAACWAFAVVANIESQLKIHKNMEVVLSEQFLIDCDNSQRGCTSGSMVRSYANIVSIAGGVLRDQDYFPYANGQQKCRWQQDQPPHPVLVTGFKRVEPREDFMLRALYDHGPLSTGISSSCIQNYKPGYILSPPANRRYGTLDHAALIVGYGYDQDQRGNWIPYWRLKNSWGQDWGDQGFFKVVRGSNACGVAQDVSFAMVN